MKTLREIKIYVDGRVKEIQEKLFELDEGIRWYFGSRITADIDAPFLFIDKNGVMTNSHYMDVFVNEPSTELKADEILAMEPEYEFKPFEQVLVRDHVDEEWYADLFSHISEMEPSVYKCVGGAWNHCIPYEGNEHLNGKSDMPCEK